MPLKDPALRAAYSKKHYRENRQKRLDTQAQYREDNLELLKQKSREYHHANRDKVLEYNRKVKYTQGHKKLWSAAQKRAKDAGIQFTLERQDVKALCDITLTCPILGIPIRPSDGAINDGSPTLDRMDNSEGYTPDNVWLISYKANRMKSNASLAELNRFSNFWMAYTA